MSFRYKPSFMQATSENLGTKSDASSQSEFAEGAALPAPPSLSPSRKTPSPPKDSDNSSYKKIRFLLEGDIVYSSVLWKSGPAHLSSKVPGNSLQNRKNKQLQAVSPSSCIGSDMPTVGSERNPSPSSTEPHMFVQKNEPKYWSPPRYRIAVGGLIFMVPFISGRTVCELAREITGRVRRHRLFKSLASWALQGFGYQFNGEARSVRVGSISLSRNGVPIDSFLVLSDYVKPDSMLYGKLVPVNKSRLNPSNRILQKIQDVPTSQQS
mmetsp:Transcript_1580/g.2247  ORF Transcript_1580/g.2247 Transcript_1580/m.2247 type:complete len:267 (-) Transcript_1580:58-858(-)